MIGHRTCAWSIAARWIYGQVLVWTIIVGGYSLVAIEYLAKKFWAWAPSVLVWTVLSPLYLAVGLWMLVTRKRVWFGH